VPECGAAGRGVLRVVGGRTVSIGVDGCRAALGPTSNNPANYDDKDLFNLL